MGNKKVFIELKTQTQLNTYRAVMMAVRKRIADFTENVSNSNAVTPIKQLRDFLSLAMKDAGVKLPPNTKENKQTYASIAKVINKVTEDLIAIINNNTQGRGIIIGDITQSFGIKNDIDVKITKAHSLLQDFERSPNQMTIKNTFGL
jgi:hypothetical protein